MQQSTIDRPTLPHRHPNGIRSDGGRNPIGRRTESDWTADATRSDTERDTMTQTEARYTPLIATNTITL